MFSSTLDNAKSSSALVQPYHLATLTYAEAYADDRPILFKSQTRNNWRISTFGTIHQRFLSQENHSLFIWSSMLDTQYFHQLSLTTLFCFVSKCLWSSPDEEHLTRLQVVPFKDQGLWYTACYNGFSVWFFYSWGIHLFLKAKHVSRVCCSIVLCSVLLLRFQFCVHPVLSVQGRFSTVYLMNVCAHLILSLAQEGVFVS